MTRMLASVTSPAEARTALDCGVDILDCKNPHAGALGALPLEVVHKIVELAKDRCPASATVGDLPMKPEILSEAVSGISATGVNFVKIGFLPSANLRVCIDALSSRSKNARLIAVLFTDLGPDFSLLEDFARAGFAGVMLDTSAKTQSLRQVMGYEKLSAFVRRARQFRLFTGLAGSLRLADIPPLLELEPDYLGFRGALCAGNDRCETLDPKAIRAVRHIMRQASTLMAEL